MNQSVPQIEPDDRTIILVDNQYNALDNNVQYGETKEERIEYITRLKNSGIISEQEFESFRKTILEQ